MKLLENTPHKYQEICSHILVRIESGELVPGSRLPGVRALGETFGCNYHTVRHAFETLAEQGILELKRGSGTFVTGRAAAFASCETIPEKLLRSTDTVGVLLPFQSGHEGYYTANLLNGLHQVAESRNLNLEVKTVSELSADTALLSMDFAQANCCAIVVPWLADGQQVGRLHDFVEKSVLPVVVPNFEQGMEKSCYRNPDVDLAACRAGTYLQCRYFQELGFSRIALLGPSVARAGNFNQQLFQYARWADCENRSSLIGLVDGTRKDYVRIVRRWETFKGELAVVVCNDEIAMDFMTVCCEEGVGIPDDFSVMGHGNNPAGLNSSPLLSSMQCPYEYIANGMVAHALALGKGAWAQLAGPEPETFFIRESCGGRRRMGHAIETLVNRLVGEVNGNQN